METLLIIDGNNLLFQMFYGMPSKIYNKRGQTIHATIGFISFVLKQIKNFNVSKIVVVFDGDISKERKDIYSDYKSNRPFNWDELPSDEVPFNEEDNIIKCLDYLGVKTLFSKEMEADDLIASITKLFEDKYKIIISSYDSDFFQLINDNVSILRYRGKKSLVYNNELFKEKFGFEPNRYVLYKSLVGDSSDNIKGIKGIGHVRACNICRVCATYNDFECSNLTKKYKDSILENIDIIIRNIKIIELNYKDSINYNIDDFNYDKDKIIQSNSEILSRCKVFN